MSVFGAIFSDVDTNSTTMEFFDPIGNPLGTFGVPSLPGTATFAFLGVHFDAGEQIARIRITTGNAPLGPDDGPGTDVVAMDDFFYSEPMSRAWHLRAGRARPRGPLRAQIHAEVLINAALRLASLDLGTGLSLLPISRVAGPSVPRVVEVRIHGDLKCHAHTPYFLEAPLAGPVSSP